MSPLHLRASPPSVQPKPPWGGGAHGSNTRDQSGQGVQRRMLCHRLAPLVAASVDILVALEDSAPSCVGGSGFEDCDETVLPDFANPLFDHG